MSQYDAVLFDFDGVLGDTEQFHFAAWREVLQQHGIDLTWPFFAEHCVGVADKDMVEIARMLVTPELSMGVLWPEYRHKKELFSRMVEDQSPIPTATVELVRSLNGMKLAVVSSSTRAEIEPILVRAGILDVFGTTVFGDDVVNLKPHPEPYLTGAERLAAMRPLVVEDSDAGAASGRAAGFQVLRVDAARNTAQLVRTELGI